MTTKLQERTKEVDALVAAAVDQGIVPEDAEYDSPSWLNGFRWAKMPSYSWWRINGRLTLRRDPEIPDEFSVGPFTVPR